MCHNIYSLQLYVVESEGLFNWTHLRCSPLYCKLLQMNLKIISNDASPYSLWKYMSEKRISIAKPIPIHRLIFRSRCSQRLQKNSLWKTKFVQITRIESIILGTTQTNITCLQLPSYISFYKLSVPYPCTTDKHVAIMYTNMERLLYVDILHQQQPTPARQSRRRRSHRDTLYPRKTYLSAAILANRRNIKGKYCTLYSVHLPFTNFGFGLNREDLLYAFILWC